MGKKQTWIKKARGYFDYKPGKLLQSVANF
jgi:hypothetical protein